MYGGETRTAHTNTSDYKCVILKQETPRKEIKCIKPAF